jgi:hypothetical protein
MNRYPVRNIYATNLPVVRHVYEPVRRNRWGPLLWKTMHSFGRLLKGIEDPALRGTLTNEVWVLFDLLIRSIPCPSCRNHATHYKQTHKLPNASTKADAFEEWAFTFHNNVNMRIQKVMIGREQANQKYSDVDPLATLMEYLKSINATTRHGVNEAQIKDKAKSIVSRIK